MIEKGTAVDRIAADTDAGGDADTERLHLRAGLVTQGAGTRDDANVAGEVDVARHDTEHGLAGADNPRAVRADDGRAPLFRIAPQIALDAHHILRRNAVADNAYQLESCIGGFHPPIRRVRP